MSTVTEAPNATVVRRLYDAIDAQDSAALAEVISPGVSVLIPGDTQLAGRYEGRDALFGYFGRLGALSGGTYRAELLDVYANDAGAVALHHGTGTRGGKTLDAHVALVFDVEDGLITNATVFQKDQDGWDDFFS